MSSDSAMETCSILYICERSMTRLPNPIWPCYYHAIAMLLPCNCHAIAMQLSCLLGARRASRHLQRVRVRVRGRSCTFHACFFCLLLAPQASNANHSNLPKRAAGLASELKLCHGRRSGFTKQTTQSKTAPAAIPKALAAGSLWSPRTMPLPNCKCDKRGNEERLPHHAASPTALSVEASAPDVFWRLAEGSWSMAALVMMRPRLLMAMGLSVITHNAPGHDTIFSVIDLYYAFPCFFVICGIYFPLCTFPTSWASTNYSRLAI